MGGAFTTLCAPLITSVFLIIYNSLSEMEIGEKKNINVQKKHTIYILF